MDKEKYSQEAMSFVDAVQRAKVLKPEFDDNLWFANFSPVLYVTYLNYIMHYYNEIKTSDIDELCDYFGNYFSCDDERFKNSIIKQMKETNHNYSNMISGVREKVKLDYAASAGLLVYIMFQLQPSPNGVIEIGEIAEKISSYRKKVEDAVLNASESIIETSSRLADITICELTARGITLENAEEHFFGFGLFCCKHLVSHNIPPEWVIKYNGREYISQYFIKLLIGNKFGLNSDSSTKAYSMYNHLKDNIDLSNGNKVLMQSYLTTLMASADIGNFDLNKINEVMNILVDQLNMVSFNFIG